MLAAVLIGAAVAATLAAASEVPGKTAHPARSITRHPLIRPRVKHSRHINPALVRRLRQTAWRWQTVIGVRHAHSVAPLRTPRALRYWRRQVRYVSRLAAHPPHKSGWLCIHRYEGSWADTGGPYWGGLQMNREFMRTYAPRLLLRQGWANRWTPLEQMWVAERAFGSGRGYWPWPVTARACGLI